MSSPIPGLYLTDFWEDSAYTRKEYVGSPLTNEVLAEVERELGYKLPAAYVALARTQNGGIPKRTCHRTAEATSWAGDHVAISGFEGLGDNAVAWNVATGTAMLLARFIPMIAPLAITGLLAAKTATPETSGTFHTDTPLLGVVLPATVVIVGTLLFLPIAVLGPVAEHLEARGQGVVPSTSDVDVIPAFGATAKVR